MAVVAITLAPTRPVLSLIFLTIAWLIVAISLYKHHFFEQHPKWEQGLYNLLLSLFIAGILTVAWLASLPVTPINSDEASSPSWLRQYVSTGWNYFKYGLMWSLPYAAGFVAAIILINLKRVLSTKQTLPESKIVIATPVNNEGVGYKHIVRGSVDPPGSPLQVLVFSGDNQWYVQGRVNIAASVWSVECTFGKEDKPGGHYNILAVLGDGLNEKTYRMLPDDLIKSNLVTVQRQVLEINCPDASVHQLKADDKTKIRELVRIAGISYQPDFGKHSPYIDFVFSVFNISLYDIVIDNHIQNGSVLFGENWEKFHYEPKIEPNQSIICKSRAANHFVVRQAVTAEEIASFRKADNLVISFGSLKISFKTNEQQSPEEALLDTNRYVETKKHGWRPLEQLAFVFGYTEDQWAKIGHELWPDEQTKLLIEERDRLRAELERTKPKAIHPKLRFEISERESQVHIDGGSEIRRINAKVKLRCLKTTDGQMAVRDFQASLHKQEGPEAVVTIIPKDAVRMILGTESSRFENGWIINEPLTNYRVFMFCLEISPQAQPTLSRDHFIRITMDAIGQDAFYREFYVDSWDAAQNSNSSITLKSS